MQEPQDIETPSRPGPKPRHAGAYPVQHLLEWAFGVEKASLGGNEIAAIGAVGPRSHGMEWVLIQRAMLGGVEIDTSRGQSLPADDAEIIAAIVHGELSPWMASIVAEHAATGSTPDWMPGATPRCVPREWHINRHGRRATTEPCGHDMVPTRRGRPRRIERRWCPVTYTPSAQEIAGARRRYLSWHNALVQVRDALKEIKLERHEVTDSLPPLTPWKRSVDKS